MVILETARLRLRTLALDDAGFYLALLNQPGYLRQIGDRGIRSLGAARQALAQGPLALQQRAGYSLYLIERRADGLGCGLCGWVQRDSLPDADLGYAMLDARCGQGYLCEAAAAVLEHGRRVLGLPRVLAVTSPDNAASQHILGKLGLRGVGSVALRPDGVPSLLFRRDFTASTMTCCSLAQK